MPWNLRLYDKFYKIPLNIKYIINYHSNIRIFSFKLETWNPSLHIWNESLSPAYFTSSVFLKFVITSLLFPLQLSW